MIQSFSCKHTKTLFEEGSCHRRWQEVEKIAPRKLDMLDAAIRLDDLRSPPGNQLEALKGDRRGQYSIRINDKWRVCFVWGASGPENVEIADYH